MRRPFRVPSVTLAIATALLSAAALGRQTTTPPVAEKKPVVDQYVGMKITDDYRWLENWEDPAVKAWSDAENAYARTVLDGLPGRDAIRARVRQLIVGSRGFAQVIARGGKLFAMETEPPKQQPFLVTLATADDPDSARVLVDPARSHGSIDWFEPSPDGALVAVSLSEGGSERGDVHLVDVASGQETAEVIPRVNYGTAGGSLCWPDGKGFYYTRYPRPGERPAEDLDFFVQIYYHALGTPTGSDRYELGKDFPKIAEPQLTCSADGRYVAVNVQNGDSGRFAQFLRGPDGRWTQLTTYSDKVAAAFFGPNDSLYFVSFAGAPHGKVLRLALTPGRAPSMAAAATIVPERTDAVIDTDFYSQRGLAFSPTRLYVLDLIGGPSQVRIFDLNGRPLGTLPLPAMSALNELTPVKNESVLYKVTTYVEPPAWYETDGASVAGGARAVKRAISNRSSIDLTGVEVLRETAVSKDGTRVPLTIVRRKGLPRSRTTPTLLTGYGGYGISQRPIFLGTQALWLEQGGIFARANLRGGGEFGETWHDAGRLTRKQNVFDDFIACAEHLIKAGYTDAAHLAIQGGSNGGLLMGAVMTQRPDLFRAVVSHVGIYDMLRVELSPNGAFNVPEFGTVKDGDQFRALRAYSPYHRVTDGTAYPPTLFLTGANDARVDPMHSRKMTARLQAAIRGGGTVLLRTSSETGHGGGTPLDLAIEQSVDVYAFLFKQLGVTFRANSAPY
jgi:prolyl oligopeptidase